MSVSKSERILNLFFLLLNTQRPITRNDIRDRVNGYQDSESESAFERMFERDKDELRSIGIKIDTAPIDPLFDDELGYVVDSDIFLTKNIEWTDKERSILSLASTFWHETEFEMTARRATLKTGAKNKLDADNANLYFHEVDKYRSLLKSIVNRTSVKFDYVSNTENTPRERIVYPRRLFRQGENWYFEAYEIQSKLVKSYQINRIFGSIEIVSASQIESNIAKLVHDNQKNLKSVKVGINQNAHLITHLTGGTAVDENTIEFSYYDDLSFAKYILRFSSIIVKIDNHELKKIYVSLLKEFQSKIGLI
ncbi:MAG: hypothetical protein RIS18_914 [Actinomycetota bacterium]